MSKAVVIRHLLLDLKALERLPDEVRDGITADRSSHAYSFSLDVTPAPQIGPAVLTTGRGIVIGQAIGEDEAGRPTAWAIEVDVDMSGRNDGHASAPKKAGRRLTVVGESVDLDP